MTSAQRGEGGVKKFPKFADKQYHQRGKGAKNPKMLLTSYMEVPKLTASTSPLPYEKMHGKEDPKPLWCPESSIGIDLS